MSLPLFGTNANAFVGSNTIWCAFAPVFIAIDGVPRLPSGWIGIVVTSPLP